MISLPFLSFPHTGGRTAAQTDGDTEHHTKTDIVRHDPEEGAKAQAEGDTAAMLVSLGAFLSF